LTGRWAKKVRGEFRYFGKVETDPKGEKALDLWLDQKDALLAGRKPRPKDGGPTIQDLCNRFLTWKKSLLPTGELSVRSFRDYYVTCENIFRTFGRERIVEDLATDDFETLRAKDVRACGLHSGTPRTPRNRGASVSPSTACSCAANRARSSPPMAVKCWTSPATSSAGTKTCWFRHRPCLAAAICPPISL
jgi:hypothetical protein